MLLSEGNSDLVSDYRNDHEQPEVDSEIQSAVFHLQENNLQQNEVGVLPLLNAFWRFSRQLKNVMTKQHLAQLEINSLY